MERYPLLSDKFQLIKKEQTKRKMQKSYRVCTLTIMYEKAKIILL